MDCDSSRTVTEQVRRSCAAFVLPLVQIDADRLRVFADGIDLDAVDACVHSSDGMSTNRFDDVIAFPSWVDEAGFLVITHGLDFGSGFRPLLHKAQLVVSEVYMHFAAAELSQVTDINGLTAIVDNVVVAMMRMTGILTVDDARALEKSRLRR
eukprot:gene20690-15211_t